MSKVLPNSFAEGQPLHKRNKPLDSKCVKDLQSKQDQFLLISYDFENQNVLSNCSNGALKPLRDSIRDTQQDFTKRTPDLSKPTSRTPPKFKPTHSKYKALQREYRDLQLEFSSFKQIQIAVNNDLKEQIQLIWEKLDTFKHQENYISPSQTQMSQRFERMLSSVLKRDPSSNKKRSGRQSPETSNSKNRSKLVIQTSLDLQPPLQKQPKTTSFQLSHVKTPNFLQTQRNLFDSNKKGLSQYNKDLLKSNSQPRIGRLQTETTQRDDQQLSLRSPSSTNHNQQSENVDEEDAKESTLYNSNVIQKSPAKREFYSIDVSSSIKTECIKIDVQGQQFNSTSICSPQSILSNRCQCAYMKQKCLSENCQHLSPSEQKRIMIKDLSHEFTRSLLNNPQENLYKQGNSIPLSEVLKGNFGSVGDRKYLVSAKWWQQLCDYVNFNTSNSIESRESEVDRRTLSKTQKEYQSIITRTGRHEVSRSFVDKFAEASNPYSRPGRIINKQVLPVLALPNPYRRELLLNNQSINLRPNLIENFDYVAVPQKLWRHLYAWYSADWSIPRVLVVDPLQPGTDNLSATRQKPLLDIYYYSYL